MLPEFNRFGRTPSKTSSLTASSSKNGFPGSTTYFQKDGFAHIEVQQFNNRLFQIGYRILHFFKRFGWCIREKNTHIRFEAVLLGELPAESPKGDQILLQAGQYHISVRPEIKTLFRKNSACQYFVAHYSPELLKHVGAEDMLKPCSPYSLSNDMRKLIQSIRLNPYRKQLLNFHYENSIRELLKLHLANTDNPLPGELNDEDIYKIYATDNLLQEDLAVHYDIPTIAQRMGMNESKLKKGFQKVFKMGVFERLSQHRMEYAKKLLSETWKTVDDIALTVGYGSRNSFITAFKKRFAITPKRWRIINKG